MYLIPTMYDKRHYTRLKVDDVNVLLYPRNLTQEVNASIADISEYGVGIRLPDNQNYMNLLNKGQFIGFQFFDDVLDGLVRRNIVVTAFLQLRHIEENSNGFFMGGRVNSDEFHRYYLSKETANFCKTLPHYAYVNC